MKTKNPTPETIRFTTLIEPQLLSNIKLISYFTNQKLYECLNESIKLYVVDFESKNNISISTLINFQHQFKVENIKEIDQ
jgi:hypothetical protein